MKPTDCSPWAWWLSINYDSMEIVVSSGSMRSLMHSHPLRSLFLTILVTIACAWLLLGQRADDTPSASARVLEAKGPLQWYRGNIHTHSLWSDGDDYLEMIALWYKERDYDFLCFTDHNVLPTTQRWSDVLKNKGGQRAYDKLRERFPEDWIDERMVDGRREVRLKTFAEVSERLAEPGKFLLLQGEEISDRFGNVPIHINVSNVQELIPPLGGDSVHGVMQNTVNAAVAQRERTGEPMLVHLNHPNFHYAITAEDLARVRGENFFEVYNGHPGVHNSGDDVHPSAERIWDVMLTQRVAELNMPLMYGLGVDDGHSYHDIPSRESEPGRGWVMVLAEGLTPRALIEAMEEGQFYASSGVNLSRVTSSAQGLDVEIDAEPGVTYRVEFIGTRKGYDRTSEPVLDSRGKPMPNVTHKYSNDIGTVFQSESGTSASYRFSGDELYVRAVITSSKPHPNPSEPGDFEQAWVQPLRGPAAPPME